MHPGANAVYIRHRRGLFDDHHLAALDQCPQPDRAGSEVEEPLGIHRRGLDHHDIRWVDEATIIVRHLAQVYRQVMRDACVMFPPVVAAEMGRKPVDMPALRICLQNCAGSGGQDRTDAKVCQRADAASKRLVKGVRLPDGSPVVEPHAGPHQSGCILRRNSLRRACHGRLPRCPGSQACRLAAAKPSGRKAVRCCPDDGRLGPRRVAVRRAKRGEDARCEPSQSGRGASGVRRRAGWATLPILHDPRQPGT